MAGFLQRLEFALARRLFRLPKPVQIALSGRLPVRIDGRALDPEMQLLITARSLRGGAELRAKTPESARERLRNETGRFSSPPPALSRVSDLTIPGPAGLLRARHYVPHTEAESPPLLVFFHGGGFVVGDLDTHDEPCRRLSHHAGVQVLSIDYRLAPEHPFPAAVEDARSAFRWAGMHGSELGADPARIGVGGDSAGGNLAAVVAKLAAADGGPAPAFQLLVYPATDVLSPTRSRALFRKGFGLSSEDIAWANENYFGSAADLGRDPRLSPLRARDLRGLCPAIVVTAGFDPLRDEGNAYGDALRAAGNEVVLLERGELVHGFINMIGVSPAALGAWTEIASELADLTGRLTPGAAAVRARGATGSRR